MVAYLSEVKSSWEPGCTRRTVLYGPHGIGKSTWASQWPSPFFVQTEDGLAHLDVPTWGLCVTLEQAWAQIMELSSEEHGYETVVVDSVDWLEKLIWDQVCNDGGKKDIGQFDYGKGYASATKKFANLLKSLNGCRDKGMDILLLAHCEIKPFRSPDAEQYDRYKPKLHDAASSLMQEWADEVLFCNFKIYTRAVDSKFGSDRSIGIGTGERVIYTSERPAYSAKNRLGLPDELPMRFDAYEKYLRQCSEASNGEKTNG